MKETVIKKIVKEWLPYIIIVVIVVLVRSYIVTPVVVRGDSMFDTLEDGEVLFLSKIHYRVSDIKRFDIVVVEDTDGDFIIKRVIGLPGETVQIVDGYVFINGKLLDDVIDEEIEEAGIAKEELIIGEDEYFVLGDNREVSADSRVKGLIKDERILGKTVFRIWPFNRIGETK